VQQLLGDLHDCDVWIALLSSHAGRRPDSTAPRGRRRADGLPLRRRKRRRLIHGRFVAYWSRLKHDRIWPRLSALLRNELAALAGADA